VGRIPLPGSLAVPEAAEGVVLIAVGSVEQRLDPLRLRVADYLHEHRLATLIVPLTTGDDLDGVERLAGRVASGLAWIAAERRLQHLPLGAIADGDAVAPMLLAMSRDPERVHAFIGWGGRPDVSAEVLARVRAPSLLVVGELDAEGLGSARAALDALPAYAELAVIDDTTEPFEDSEGMASFARLAQRWLHEHLGPTVA
jgi:putative phosphoribosyl transferase